MSATNKPGPGNFSFRQDGVVFIGSGAQLYSHSGRALQPAPKIDLDTDRKATASGKRMDAWLLAEAKLEAERTGQDFLRRLLDGINLSNLSTADRETICLALFGCAEGAIARNTVPGQGVQATPDPVLLRPLGADAAAGSQRGRVSELYFSLGEKLKQYGDARAGANVSYAQALWTDLAAAMQPLPADAVTRLESLARRYGDVRASLDYENLPHAKDAFMSAVKTYAPA